MLVDDYKFRPITFQGVTFPPTLMGVSVLEPILNIADEELGDWLWRLPICCGIAKSAPAERCVRCARRMVNLLLEQRQRVVDGIRERLVTHGFDPAATYRDWLLAFQRIAELSDATDEECVWSAPSHPRDRVKSANEAQQFLAGLEKWRAKTVSVES